MCITLDVKLGKTNSKMLAVLILDRVANNFKTPGDLWAPILTSFISPH